MGSSAEEEIASVSINEDPELGEEGNESDEEVDKTMIEEAAESLSPKHGKVMRKVHRFYEDIERLIEIQGEQRRLRNRRLYDSNDAIDIMERYNVAKKKKRKKRFIIKRLQEGANPFKFQLMKKKMDSRKIVFDKSKPLLFKIVKPQPVPVESNTTKSPVPKSTSLKCDGPQNHGIIETDKALVEKIASADSLKSDETSATLQSASKSDVKKPRARMQKTSPTIKESSEVKSPSTLEGDKKKAMKPQPPASGSNLKPTPVTKTKETPPESSPEKSKRSRPTRVLQDNDAPIQKDKKSSPENENKTDTSKAKSKVIQKANGPIKNSLIEKVETTPPDGILPSIVRQPKSTNSSNVETLKKRKRKASASPDKSTPKEVVKNKMSSDINKDEGTTNEKESLKIVIRQSDLIANTKGTDVSPKEKVDDNQAIPKYKVQSLGNPLKIKLTTGCLKVDQNLSESRAKDSFKKKKKDSEPNKIAAVRLHKDRVGKNVPDVEAPALKLVLKLPSFSTAESSNKDEKRVKKVKEFKSKKLKHKMSGQARP